MSEATAEADGVVRLRQPVTIVYEWSAGPAATGHLQGLLEGRLVGKRCPKCELVYCPPRNGVCPRCAVPLGEPIEVGPRGTITTFCIVNVPFLGQKVKIPYVAAQILLDGADISVQHLIQECEASDVHIGMRVEAVWKPRDEWGPTLESIAHFRPCDEPDVTTIAATS
ncbi:MAG: Zn-ribbon domain-containing OB-fold protein [Ilumatobacteraceae bacterium]